MHNAAVADRYTDAHFATPIEHESTHCLEPTAERLMDYEVRAHTEEYKFAERVYGDNNPWKDDDWYQAWKTGDMEKFKKVIWDGGYKDARYIY